MLGTILLSSLFPHLVGKINALNCPVAEPFPIPQEWYQSGSFIIGGMVSQMFYHFNALTFMKHPSQEFFNFPIVITKRYQNALALAFAVKEINENPKILPNVTLGFHIYDSYYSDWMTYRTTMDMIFKSHKFIPNYKCDKGKNLMAIIGGLTPDVSFRMADIINLYKVPQLTYGSFNQEENKTSLSASLYHMVPNEFHQYKGIIKLLLHFGWTWVGLFVVDDDSGEHFIEIFETLLSQNAICSAITQRIRERQQLNTWEDIVDTVVDVNVSFKMNQVTTFIIYGGTFTIGVLTIFLSLEDPISLGRVCIMTAQVDFALMSFQKRAGLGLLDGAISFTSHSKQLPRFQQFLQLINPYKNQGDGFLKDFWEQAFDCSCPSPQEANADDRICTGEENLDSLPGPFFEIHMTGHSYSIYNAAYAISHALHVMLASGLKSVPKVLVGNRRSEHHDLQPWQLHLFLQSISFNSSDRETMYFNDQREMRGRFDIMNIITFPNMSFQRVIVGSVDPFAEKGKGFILNEDRIVWHRDFNQSLPLSVCNDFCYPGYHKKSKDGEKFCCYDCIPCPEGKVSNMKDMDDCISCSEDQYSSKELDGCIPKAVSFLSYEEPLGISLATLAILLCLISVWVLGIFFKHRNTPIVKANNWNLTVTLLISLQLCFLCSLLFIGQPDKVTCLLRQPAFGIIFSVAVSCILTKTITVVVAFVATRPGPRRRRLMGKRVANFIILFCSSVQVGFCVVWLAVSPPFPDLDLRSSKTEIVRECNEGSVTMLYLVLGYMGFLAVISFTMAFLARNLPDSFNEAKFITFSMLIFCSVWLCFVPSHMSTKGKYMVVVEIFSILASSLGLLSCIFSPKCYIIVLRPELNNRDHVTWKKNGKYT